MCNLFNFIKTAFLNWANNPTSYDGKLLKQYNTQFKNN